MTEEERKELDLKFDKYFKETFIIDRGDLFDKYNERKIDVSFNLEEEKYTTPKNVFKTIKKAFENGNTEEMELFLRKLDLLAKDKVDIENSVANRLGFTQTLFMPGMKNYTQREMVVVDGKYVMGYNTMDVHKLRSDSLTELLENKDDVSKINFRNVSELLNTMDSKEIYAILNSDINSFSRMRVERAAQYIDLDGMLDDSEAIHKKMEILALQRYLDRKGHIAFNRNFIDEFVADMIRYGARNTISAYFLPLKIIPKYLLFGPGSLVDTVKQIAKIHRNDRLEKLIGDEKEYKFEYKMFEKMKRKEYYHSELDEVKDMDVRRKQIKASNIENILEMVEFNSQDYLAEYKELVPFIKKYKLRKKSMSEMRSFYHNLDRVYTDLERRSGRRLSDITKKLIKNDLVLNIFVEKELIDKSYVVVEDINSRWFGTKIPVVDGEVDEETLMKALVVVGDENLQDIIKEMTVELGKKQKILKQIVESRKDVSGSIDLGEGREENLENVATFISDIFFSKEWDECYELAEKIIGPENENVLLEQPLLVTFGGQKYSCATKLDARLLSVCDANFDRIDKNWLKDHIENKVEKTVGQHHIYNYIFEDLYQNITRNPNFKLSAEDLKTLDDKKTLIERKLRNYETIENIVDDLGHLKDYNKVKDILTIFQKNYDVNDVNTRYGENFSIDLMSENKHEQFRDVGSTEGRDENYAEKEDGNNSDNPISVPEIKEVLSSQSEETVDSAIRLISQLEINAHLLENEKTKEQETYDQNFKAVMTGEPRLNIVEKYTPSAEFLAAMTYLPEEAKARESIDEINKEIMSKEENKLFNASLKEVEFLPKDFKELLLENEHLSYKLHKTAVQNKYELEIFGFDKKNPLALIKIEPNASLPVKEQKNMAKVLENFSIYKPERKAITIARAMEGTDLERMSELLKMEKREKMKKLSNGFSQENEYGRLSENTKMLMRLVREDYSSKKYSAEKIKEVNLISKEIMNYLKKDKIDRADGFSEETMEKFQNGTLTLKELGDEIAKKLNLENNPLESILSQNNLTKEIKDALNEDKKGKENNTETDKTVSDAKRDLERFEKHRENVKEQKVFDNINIEKQKNRVENTKKEVESVKNEIKEETIEINRELMEDKMALENIENSQKQLATKKEAELMEETMEKLADENAINVSEIKGEALKIDEAEEEIKALKEQIKETEKDEESKAATEEERKNEKNLEAEKEKLKEKTKESEEERRNKGWSR